MERRDRVLIQKVLQELRMEDVYETVVTDFPALQKQLEEIL